MCGLHRDYGLPGMKDSVGTFHPKALDPKFKINGLIFSDSCIDFRLICYVRDFR